MIQIRTTLRRVGNSFGIIVPSEIVHSRKLREGEELVIQIQSKNKTNIGAMLLEARRKKLKFKRSTQEIMKEIDESLE